MKTTISVIYEKRKIYRIASVSKRHHFWLKNLRDWFEFNTGSKFRVATK